MLLTSLTPIVGMRPTLLERSKEAQVVSPMATSSTFRLALCTLVVLVLIPVTAGFAITNDEDHDDLADRSNVFQDPVVG
ncbi:probable multidrug resistance protein [Blastopirellula marina DSM 3645]|uniref:Probable multidrug resistance protein n=1 Tax=Blastopirellula marina DSM 3645 TaxID=314230 RepID=A3ZZC1_9BACT|nr:probable multidrug resistance protein [Blastopirellula marina DSM 3645]